MVQKYNIFQINQLLKNLNYLGFLILAMLVFFTNKYFGLVMAPFFIFGIILSGIPYFGGIANAVPFLVALLAPIALLVVKQLSVNHKTYITIMTLIGCLHVFFYLLDGSLMLALPLILITSWFLLFDNLPKQKRIIWSTLLPSIYMVGFIASLLIKQVLSSLLLGFDIAFNEFIEIVLFRSGDSLYGNEIILTQTLEKIFYFFNIETYRSDALYFIIVYAGLAFWALSIAIIIFLLILGRNRELLMGSGIFFLAAIAIFARFYLMMNHSYEHAFIVGRYLFVPMSFGWCIFIYQILSFTKGSVKFDSSHNKKVIPQGF